MAQSNGRYCVVIDEKHPDGWTVRRMLVARFVAVGDAVSYAMWRAETTKGKPWVFVVETANATRSMYEFPCVASVEA